MSKCGTTHHLACACREARFAELEKDNLRLRLEQARFRTVLAEIADNKGLKNHSAFARRAAENILGRKKH